MLIGRGRELRVATAISVSVFDKEVEGIGHFKYLGVTLSSNFTWTEHIELICFHEDKSTLMALRIIKSLVPRSARILFFNTLILPMFDYVVIVWGDKDYAVLINNLKLLQNKAAKNILDRPFRPFHSSATGALEALGWLTLEKRRLFHRCFYVYKCFSEISAHSLDLLANKDVHGYDTRHKLKITWDCPV